MVNRNRKRAFIYLRFTIYALSRPVGVNNLRKALGIQTRSANQRAVDVRFFHQASDIVRLYRTPVKNAQSVCCRLGMPFRENAPDKRVHFLRLLRRRSASSPDGPDRFVSHDDTVEVRGCQPGESAAYL